MCGHVGMAGKLTPKHDKVLKTLLVLDSVRGEDSTGIAAVNRFTGKVKVAKQLGDPFQLFQDKRYENAMQGINKVFIGHNRYATSGGVSRLSAHPFEFDTLVGAHNGTLSSKHKLLDAQDFRVDSENLYYHIEQKGLDDALSQLGGYGNAWALVWWNKEHETLNLLRNEERPLYLCRSEDKEVLFWASEAWMLSVALSRHDIKHDDIFQLEKDKLHTIHVDKDGVMSKPVIRKAQAPVPAVVTYLPNQKQMSWKTDTKKQNVTSVGGTTCDEQYLRAKGVTFEVLGRMVDDSGSAYMFLFDSGNPFEEVRLYERKGDDFASLEGGLIKADLSGWVAYKGSNKGYYKVTPWSVCVLTKPIKEDHTLFPTHKGSFVNKKEWEDMYKDCAWCSSPLLAEEANEFSTQGQCLCPGCAKDAEVMKYIAIRH